MQLAQSWEHTRGWTWDVNYYDNPLPPPLHWLLLYDHISDPSKDCALNNRRVSDRIFKMMYFKSNTFSYEEQRAY